VPVSSTSTLASTQRASEFYQQKKTEQKTFLTPTA
jgi:hypothetical protein